MGSADDILDAASESGPDAPAWVAENLRVLSRIAAFGEDLDDAASAPRALPCTMGAYELVERIGSGGMGEVYRAVQTAPVAREVAFKILRVGGNSRRAAARFASEKQTLARLEHEGIAKIYDAGVDETGVSYFAMELVAGLPITAFCDLHRLDVRERLRLFTQVCRAIQHAHQRGVIHRDVKPSNVLVAEREGRAVAKLIDFGVAKATQDTTDGVRQTEAGQILGTPEYMSPEQFEAPESVDTRADLYSLGALLYELLSGVPPFDAASLRGAGVAELVRTMRSVEPAAPSVRVGEAGEMIGAIAERRRLAPEGLRRTLRGDLDRITQRAMEKDPARRYASASEFAADVERFLEGEPVLAVAPSVPYVIGKFARRHRGLFAAGAAILFALGVGAVATMRESARARRAEAEARGNATAAESVSGFLAGMLGAANPETDIRARDLTVGEALDEAAARIEGEFAGRPRIEAKIRATIGAAYTALRRDEEAVRHLKRAADLTRMSGSPAERAETASALAFALLHSGRVDEAVGMAREALRSTEVAYPEGDVRRVRAATDLAKILGRAGVFAEADSLFRAAIESSRAEPDADGITPALRVHEYAHLLDERGRFAEAEAAFRESVAAIRTARGPRHPDAIRATSNLANFLREQGASGESESLFVETLAAARETLGPDHTSTGVVLAGYGALLTEAGEPARAESALAAAVDVLRRGGEARPEVAIALGHLGIARRAQGDAAGALTAFREAMAIDRRVYAREHPAVFRSVNNLASAHLQQGDAASAEVLFREALQIALAVHGEAHPEAALVTQNLAKALAGQGRFAETESTYRRALAQGAAALPAGHPHLAIMNANLGESLLRLGHRAAAESALAPAIETMSGALGADHPRVAQAREWLREARGGVERKREGAAPSPNANPPRR